MSCGEQVDARVGVVLGVFFGGGVVARVVGGVVGDVGVGVLVVDGGGFVGDVVGGFVGGVVGGVIGDGDVSDVADDCCRSNWKMCRLEL